MTYAVFRVSKYCKDSRYQDYLGLSESKASFLRKQAIGNKKKRNARSREKNVYRKK